MRSSRSPFLALGGIALFSGMLALAALAPTTAQACPESAGACPCGEACASEHAGNCGGDDAAAAGCADKDEQAACACPAGEDGKCACGAECGAKHGGDCKAAAGAGTDKKPCGCKGAGAASTPPGEKAAPCGQDGGAEQRAVIDPTTGQLIVPGEGETAAPSDVAASGSEPEASAKPGAGTAQQLAVPGGGVMAPFPQNRASNAVATVGESGGAHTGCEHGEH